MSTEYLEADSRLYVSILRRTVKAAMLLLCLSYLVYLLPGVPLHLAPEHIAAVWKEPAHAFTALHATQGPAGNAVPLLSWDLLPLYCIGFIASISLVCVAALAVFYLRRAKTLYAALAAVQVLVFAVAMSGLGNALIAGVR